MLCLPDGQIINSKLYKFLHITKEEKEVPGPVVRLPDTMIDKPSLIGPVPVKVKKKGPYVRGLINKTFIKLTMETFNKKIVEFHIDMDDITVEDPEVGNLEKEKIRLIYQSIAKTYENFESPEE